MFWLGNCREWLRDKTFDIRVSLVDTNILISHLDSIEGNVEQAVVHVTEANVQLQRAKDYQVSGAIRCAFLVLILPKGCLISLQVLLGLGWA